RGPHRARDRGLAGRALDGRLLDDAVALGGAVDGRPGARLPGAVGRAVVVERPEPLLAAAGDHLAEIRVGVLATDHPVATAHAASQTPAGRQLGRRPRT